jgi:large subunit ribosomal protein L23
MNIIEYPLNTEKSITQMEEGNKLAFIVNIKANKTQIKEELQDMLDCKVNNVNTMITSKGKKKAYVTFHEDSPAIDIATQLGLL